MAEIQTDGIYESLKQDIVHLRIEPNKRLTEQQLSEEFGSSRTPIREALRKLEHEGWIVRIPHQGYYVRSMTIEEVEDCYEVRIALEKLAVKLAIQKQDLSVLEQLLQKWKKMPRSWEETIGLQLLASEKDFHETITYVGGNKELHQHLQRVNEKISVTGRIDYHNKNWASTLIDEKIAILESILERDVEKAESLIEKHIRGNKENLKTLWYRGRS